jgi:hypothetical protein
MKLAVVRIILVILAAIATIGCSNYFTAPPSEFSQQSLPAKEILVSYGRYDKPYETLGPIEYILKNASIPDDRQNELWDQAIELLKQEALKKYGDKVDAIVDVEIIESSEEINGKNFNIILAKGVAIAFSSGIKPTSKHKIKYKVRHKPKSSKSTSSKIKPAKKAPSKIQTEEIEITPSELLK